MCSRWSNNCSNSSTTKHIHTHKHQRYHGAISTSAWNSTYSQFKCQMQRFLSFCKCPHIWQILLPVCTIWCVCVCVPHHRHHHCSLECTKAHFRITKLTWTEILFPKRYDTAPLVSSRWKQPNFIRLFYPRGKNSLEQPAVEIRFFPSNQEQKGQTHLNFLSWPVVCTLFHTALLFRFCSVFLFRFYSSHQLSAIRVHF